LLIVASHSNSAESLGYSLLTLAAILGLGYWGWTSADRSGYLIHSEVTDITVSADWRVGERKVCVSPIIHGQKASMEHKSEGYAMSIVACDDSPTETLKVAFYGRTKQPDYDGVQWNCIRNKLSWREAAAFTCKQTAGLHLK